MFSELLSYRFTNNGRLKAIQMTQINLEPQLVWGERKKSDDFCCRWRGQMTCYVLFAKLLKDFGLYVLSFLTLQSYSLFHHPQPYRCGIHSYKTRSLLDVSFLFLLSSVSTVQFYAILNGAEFQLSHSECTYKIICPYFLLDWLVGHMFNYDVYYVYSVLL